MLTGWLFCYLHSNTVSSLTTCFASGVFVSSFYSIFRQLGQKLRFYSTLVTQQSKMRLDPHWITGFIDGEGSFIVFIRKTPKFKIGWSVEAKFQIGLHQRDREILELIKFYFLEQGNIYKQGENGIMYKVTSLSILINIIIYHFEKYPLITQKQADFELFKMVVLIMSRKEHLTIEGLKKLVSIKASLNLGLSDKLKKAFPTIVPVLRPLVVDQIIKDPNWVAGFTCGEGCFNITILNSLSNLVGYQVRLTFQITQHSRDKQFMESLIEYFKVGKCYYRDEAIDFRVTKIENLTNIIIPFFNKYPIIGVKNLDFDDWCKVAELMKNKAHLTLEGLEEIKKIKKGINRERK